MRTRTMDEMRELAAEMTVAGLHVATADALRAIPGAKDMDGRDGRSRAVRLQMELDVFRAELAKRGAL